MNRGCWNGERGRPGCGRRDADRNQAGAPPRRSGGTPNPAGETPALPPARLKGFGPDRGGSRWNCRSGGFTLVELLTVMAIIAVLATLLMTALVSAKRKTRQAACTSNLRQISLALNMYLDDQEKRPDNLTVLASSKYLPAAGVLRCPEDKTGNWGGLVESSLAPTPPPTVLVSAPTFGGLESTAAKIAAPAAGAEAPPPALIPYSYLHPLPWEKWAWDRLNASASGVGIAACQWHGLGKPNLDWPRMQDLEGLVLRAQRDGAVVRRQVFWDRPQEGARLMLDAAATISTSSYPWRLFIDETEPQ